MTGLPLDVVSGWDEVEADLWLRAAAESTAQVRALVPDLTSAMLEAALTREGG